MSMESPPLPPKVVLHEHLEGTVTPKTAKKLAKRHGVTLPEDLFKAPGTYDEKEFPEGCYEYENRKTGEKYDFNKFLNVYDTVSELIRTPRDYYDITHDYLSRAAKEGVVYSEIILSPDHMAREGKNRDGNLSTSRYRKALAAIKKAAGKVEKESSLKTRFIATGVRSFGKKNVQEVANFIRTTPDEHVVGFGLAGNEQDGDFSDFRKALKETAKQGAGLPLSLHAGEIRGAESIRDALETGATRIGHGIRAMDDPALVKKLARNKTLLEVCPTSNKILVPEMKGSLEKHPARRLYEAGVPVTFNPDDAGMFGTTPGREYDIARKIFGFSRGELFDVALCGIESAFAGGKDKQEMKKKVLSRMEKSDRDDLESTLSTTRNPELRKRLTGRIQDFENTKQRDAVKAGLMRGRGRSPA